ncbi:phosphoribosylanthranilate isomerase [Adhaeribacter rhizoryzae]|uniref:N-(5'-phosphoribosyl)anthranilate isomerase n=1 Tax=Adhaeribacter rhizoryzae TaxID=2607907 RepID=A0A5M6DB78_9BACT|nr:phosphoribosylanthranilate isomerase [Adhaeribacter rhizoryzae]KAA5544801.1 phosphoribosylanthranilate isomerase [Adhaeribacter rhizoryzae]
MQAAANLDNRLTQDTLRLKVCGMRQAENIEAILALKPDYLGFIFYPKSSRFVGEELPAEILNQIPTSTQKVGVFVNEPVANILEKVRKYKLDAVQLHGEESPAMCQELKAASLIVLKAFSVDDAFDFNTLKPYEGTCHYYLFDTKGKEYGGNGVRFNWEILKNYSGETPFFMSGGIDLEHAAQIKALELPLLKGIDINSRFELSPALKDSNKVASFFRQIREPETTT